MSKRLRSSLTYANVVSTLALVLVIGGGGAYASTRLINGSQLKNRSVTGAKVKRGTLTRAEINIKKLGRVSDSSRLGGKLPSAFQKAGSYQPAGSYLPAGGTAANANALGGQPPGAYLPAARVLSGSATTTTPSQTILTYAPLGLTVKTASTITPSRTMKIVLSAATMTLDVSYGSGLAAIRPGTDWTRAPDGSSTIDVLVVRSTDQPSVGLTLVCGYDTTPYVVNCTGTTLG